jgi:hypothetical protein
MRGAVCLCVSHVSLPPHPCLPLLMDMEEFEGDLDVLFPLCLGRGEKEGRGEDDRRDKRAKPAPSIWESYVSWSSPTRSLSRTMQPCCVFVHCLQKIRPKSVPPLAPKPHTPSSIFIVVVGARKLDALPKWIGCNVTQGLCLWK